MTAKKSLFSAVLISAVAGTIGLAHAAEGEPPALIADTPVAKGPIADVVWALGKEPASLDPAQSNEFVINQVLSNLCETLFVINPDFKVENWLATGVTQPDDKTYLYKIRKDAKFWDGSPVTTADVAFSLQRNLDPNVKSRWARYYINVDKVEAVDDETVKVTLKQPDIMFNSAMATAASAVIKKSHAEANGNVIGTPQVAPMCSGPFKLTAWNTGSSIILEKNKDYWNPTHAALADKFEFKFVVDTSAQVNGLITGQLQGMYGPTGTAIGALKKATAGKLYFGKSFSNYQLIPNMRPDATSVAANEKIRQALSLAINRTAIAAKVFNGAAIPTISPAPSAAFSNMASANPNLEVPAINLEKAKALVAEAGPIEKPLLLAYGARSDYEMLASLIMDAGRKIGVPIELKAVPYDQYVAAFFDGKLRQNDFMMMTKNINMTDPLDFFSVFTPSFAALNFGHYDNPEVVDRIVKARSETDEAKRSALISEAQNIIVREKAWIPLVEFTNALYMDGSITGAPASYVFPYYPWAAQVGAAK
jgi:peptide/nickel transport system substrate-binding protein